MSEPTPVCTDQEVLLSEVLNTLQYLPDPEHLSWPSGSVYETAKLRWFKKEVGGRRYWVFRGDIVIDVGVTPLS